MKFNINDKVIINNHLIGYIVDFPDGLGMYGVSCVEFSDEDLHYKYDTWFYSPDEIRLFEKK